MVKFQNCVPNVYMATSIDVVVFKRHKFVFDGKSLKSCLIYRIKNFGFLSNCRYCADRAQNLPGLASDIWLKIFQISSKSVHFRWSYSQMREGRSFGP